MTLALALVAVARPVVAQQPPTASPDTVAAEPEPVVEPEVVVDTVVVAVSPTEPPEREHSPRGALLRGLVVPGWGQVYNRQFWKLPFAYGALGGMVALAVRNYRNHRAARRAFLYAAGLEEDPNPYAEFAPYYLGTTFEGISADQLFSFKNSQLRNRDIAFVGVLVVHGLVVLDAYVAAHLFDFDVGEDLSVGPRIGPEGVGAVVRVRW